MESKLPITIPELGPEEQKAAAEAIASGWILQGPRVAAFEAAFSRMVGAPYACAVSSGTAALHLALLAVGTHPGDVVLTVSHSFIATANAVRACGAEPYFVDIDLATFNMAPGELRASLERDFEARDGGLWLREVDRLAVGGSPLVRAREPRGRLAAIMVAHQVGLPADLGAILPLARSYGVPVVEDAACAVGTEVSLDGGATFENVGRPHGALACFSFHPRKVITTGEGGMITTADETRDEHCRLVRQHGMAADPALGFLVTGHNYRMTDIQAAIGLEQLKRLPGILAARRRIAGAYLDRLAGVPGLRVPIVPVYARHNWQSFIVQLEEPARQSAVMQSLLDEGVSTRTGVMCAHRELPYADAWRRASLPNSELAQDAGISLPIYPRMTEKDVERVVSALSRALHRKDPAQ
ncbi:MAG: DegT/DnrJ/EryC1/StrS family aminotransferase [Deltaproteobacteria bacterium]|nr:DegT/DnrJ/EryC1/StrS family aminotransferase [Deltaproteobacteria bacterium]